jgi:hypothetical protein
VVGAFGKFPSVIRRLLHEIVCFWDLDQAALIGWVSQSRAGLFQIHVFYIH